MRETRNLAVCLLTFCLVSSLAVAQGSGGNPTPSITNQLPDASQPDGSIADPQFGAQRNGDPRSTAEQRVEKQMEKERSKQRWLDIKKRSERLLEVATELKQYVDKSGENVLSLEVLKKAEEMEKLSKELQKKIKTY